MMEMIGRRVYADANGKMPPMHEGDYGCFDGEWWGFAPGAALASFADHEVQEHEDGTITVNPSVVYDRPFLPNDTDHPAWHGYLVRGVWKDTQ